MAGTTGGCMSRLRTVGLAAAFVVFLSADAMAASRDGDSRDIVQRFLGQVRQHADADDEAQMLELASAIHRRMREWESVNAAQFKIDNPLSRILENDPDYPQA